MMVKAPYQRKHLYRDLPAFLQMLRRLVRAAGRRAAQADPDDLAELIGLRDDLDAAIVEAVRGLRASGSTWEDIGSATGTTRQAALMKWGPKL